MIYRTAAMSRRFALGMLAATALTLSSFDARAQTDTYPSKPIRLIVAFATGSGNDLVARELARQMSETLGQPVVVENRLGAGGVTGTDTVARAAPDGYTVGLGTSSQFVMNVGLNETLPFDIDKDVKLVGLIARTQMVLAAGPSGPKSIAELVAKAKADPRAIKYGSGGAGSINHILAESLASKLNIQMLHVPFKGSGAAVIDLAGDRIDINMDALNNTRSFVEAGKVRLIAISGDKRNPQRPDLPTFKEAGLPDYQGYTWNNLFVPAKTPDAIVAKLNDALGKALASEPVKKFIAGNGGEIIGPATPAEANKFSLAERERWVPFIRSLKIDVQQ